MPNTVDALRLGEAHRLAQSKVGAQTVQLMFAAWRLLDPVRLDVTFPVWLTIVLPLIQQQRLVSARLAGNYLTTARTLELGATFTPVYATPAPTKAIVTSMTVTGPASIKAATARGVNPDAAAVTALARTSAAAVRHALDGGRETVLATVKADPRAAGWQRITSGKACEFCTMLAGRGAVYSADTSEFRSHDGCHCGAAVTYR